VVHTYNLSTQEAEGRDVKFKDRLGYTVRERMKEKSCSIMILFCFSSNHIFNNFGFLEKIF
jgi:hypothetical protein